MQFNSYIFVFAFMPVVVITFHLLSRISKRAADILILLASVVFYAYGGLLGLAIVIADALINTGFIMYLRKKKSKPVLIVSIVLNIAAILVLRMTPGVLGISFISFQMIAFTVETYKGFGASGKEDESYSLLDLWTFVFYFPKVVAGPLVKPRDFIAKLHDDKRYVTDADNLASGFVLFTIGAFKKVLIGDVFAKIVGWGFSNFDTSTSMDWVLILLAHLFQLYFDFSGYCDMAGGVSRMINLELPQNFDSPLKSCSVAEFWRRWHITLMDFIKNYIYIPLGGSRKGTLRTCINLMIIFVVSGIWHGQKPVFAVWGLINGALSILHKFIAKKYEKLHVALQWLITMATLGIVHIMVMCGSIRQWIDIIKKIVLIEDMSVSDGLIQCCFSAETSTLLNITGLGFMNFVPIRYLIAFFIFALIFNIGPENIYGKRFKYSIPLLAGCAVLFMFVAISLGGETTFYYQRF